MIISLMRLLDIQPLSYKKGRAMPCEKPLKAVTVLAIRI